MSNPTPQKGIHVPAGRTLADMPPPEAKPCPPEGKRSPINARMTIREFVTENEVKNYLVGFLTKMAAERKKGPWREYLEFYRLNQSGDVDLLKPEVRKYVEKMRTELNDAYFEAQDM